MTLPSTIAERAAIRAQCGAVVPVRRQSAGSKRLGPFVHRVLQACLWHLSCLLGASSCVRVVAKGDGRQQYPISSVSCSPDIGGSSEWRGAMAWLLQ